MVVKIKSSELEGYFILTVNREYFDVKIFSDSMTRAKIKRTKYMRDINDNAVQGRLSENMKSYRMKYFRHEIFTIYGTYIVLVQMQIHAGRNY